MNGKISKLILAVSLTCGLVSSTVHASDALPYSVAAAFGLTEEQFDGAAFENSDDDNITVENYKRIYEYMNLRMEAFIKAKKIRDEIMQKVSYKIKNTAHFTSRLSASLNFLCNKDPQCLDGWSRIEKGIFSESDYLKLLEEALQDESVISDFLKFRSEYIKAESSSPSGGIFVLASSKIFQRVYSYQDKLYRTLGAVYPNNNRELGQKLIMWFTSDGKEVKYNFATGTLKIFYGTCNSEFIVALDLKKGTLMTPDQSGYEDRGPRPVKRLPYSFLPTLIGKRKISVICKEKIFTKNSITINKDQSVTITVRQIKFPSYTVDEFGMGGGGGWHTKYITSEMTAQIY